MAKAAKLLEAMRRNPQDWRIEQLKSVAEAYGLVWRQPGSSHVTFRHPGGAMLTVPAKRPIKPIPDQADLCETFCTADRWH